MPADLWTDAARMAGCGLLVAAVAVPIGLAARFIAKTRGQPILLRPRPWTVPWSGFELFILFAFAMVGSGALVGPLLSASGFYPAVYGPDADAKHWEPMRPHWSTVIYAPVFVGLLWVSARLAYPNWRRTPPAPAARTAAGVGTWLVLHPLVAAVHFGIAFCFLLQDWQPDVHPLEEKFRNGRPVVDQILFAVEATLAAPIMEELLFRGALLTWLLGKKHRPLITLILAAIFGFLLSFENVDGRNELRYGPALFALLLPACGFLHRMLRRKHQRTESAIIVSAAFFALVHNSVWPSPIPLFVLGLGLGWLAVRTRGILAPIIVHGLFNAVSVVFLLRG